MSLASFAMSNVMGLPEILMVAHLSCEPNCIATVDCGAVESLRKVMVPRTVSSDVSGSMVRLRSYLVKVKALRSGVSVCAPAICARKPNMQTQRHEDSHRFLRANRDLTSFAFGAVPRTSL